MQRELNFRRKGFFRNPADPYFIAHQAEKHFLTTPTEIKNENGKKSYKSHFPFMYSRSIEISIGSLVGQKSLKHKE